MAVAEGVKTTIIRPHFEERLMPTVPSVAHLLDAVAALAKLKTDRLLVCIPAGAAFKPSELLPGSPRRRIRRRYRATLRSGTTKPSFLISPWILGAPQSDSLRQAPDKGESQR
jgi:hypothetical protein